MKEDSSSILIILGIVALALFGGATSPNLNDFASANKVQTQEESAQDIQYKINETQYKVNELQKQVADETAKKFESPYKDLVSIKYINRSNDPSQEYIAIQASYSTKNPIKVTGWRIQSQSTVQSVTIPKGTYLFFTGMANSEDDIYLTASDTMYISTGVSPNGSNFKLNKCSGYLGQFQTYVPYIPNFCPAPKDEDLSSIPKSARNDSCFDYIESMQQCRVQTDPLPSNLSYECVNFINNKINYPTCINTHKGDKDFYQKEWRVYLKRNDKLWKDRRETLTLYDEQGKIVDTFSY